MTSRIEYLLRSTEELWKKYVRHEFVVRMREGNLPLDIFRYYLIQDSKYVEGMLRALLLPSGKGPVEDVVKILNSVFSSRDKGMENNKRLYSLLNISKEEIEKTGYNLINYAYTRHLYYHASIGWEEFLVAVTPCMLGYSEIGDYVIESKNEVFKLWASFYASEDYKRRVYAILDSLDKIVVNDRTLKIFERSIR
ncbi:TenA family transcriptional regulator, partial [Sulfolobus sp. A20-N-F6]